MVKMMRRRQRLFLSCACIAFAWDALAGNKEMMDDNARELVRVSEQVLTESVDISPNGHYSFSARVVGQGPSDRFDLDRLSVSELTGEGAVEEVLTVPVDGHDQTVVRGQRKCEGGNASYRLVFNRPAFAANDRYESLITIRSIPAPVYQDARLVHWQRGTPASNCIGKHDPYTPILLDLAPKPNDGENDLGPGGGSLLREW
jgi:hypothetical protein